jgi:hypothetical protein
MCGKTLAGHSELLIGLLRGSERAEGLEVISDHRCDDRTMACGENCTARARGRDRGTRAAEQDTGSLGYRAAMALERITLRRMR